MRSELVHQIKPRPNVPEPKQHQNKKKKNAPTKKLLSRNNYFGVIFCARADGRYHIHMHSHNKHSSGLHSNSTLGHKVDNMPANSPTDVQFPWQSSPVIGPHHKQSVATHRRKSKSLLTSKKQFPVAIYPFPSVRKVREKMGNKHRGITNKKIGNDMTTTAFHRAATPCTKKENRATGGARWKVARLCIVHRTLVTGARDGLVRRKR